MRAAPFATIVGLTLGLLSQTVLARDPLTVGSSTPANYDAMKTDLDKIPPYLDGAQCGGWQNRTVSGSIAVVKGVPGRNGLWSGAILTGMATRLDENNNGDIDDDFVYPTTAKGFATSCNADQKEIGKTVWRLKQNGLPNEIEQVNFTYPHPQFSDPSCRWRVRDKNGDLVNTAPDVPLTDNEPTQNFDQLTDGPDKRNPPGDRLSPPLCVEFCQYLNTWQYYDCLETGTGETLDDPPVTYNICKRWGNKYLCTDQEVTNQEFTCFTNGSDLSNGRFCVGSECRCQQLGGPTPGNGCVANPGTQPNESPRFYSFYRDYIGEFSRDAVRTDKGRDVASGSAKVACYGFYDEFDPKYHQTQDKDRRCVINIDVSGRPDSQTGKSEYGQNSNITQRDPNDPANQRPPSPTGASGAFDKDKDLWYEKLSGGFSLLNEKVFSDTYDKDLTNVFLNTAVMDSAKMRATEQLGPRRSYASGSFIRSFDDTGVRNVDSWWQTQQTAVASIMHPPIVRMILPSGWAMGVDPNDPFFKKTDAKILTPSDKRDDRIEIQINADDDTLGAALSYIQRSLLLRVTEEPVRAVIPVGSAVEFRSKAEAWCLWYMEQNGKKDCKDAPADVQLIMKTLEDYAANIDQYRVLRAELALYASKVLDIQQSVTKPITDWMSQNIGKYQKFLEQERLNQQQFATKWRDAQLAYEKFGSQTNLPWCMNQRFTLPLYPLLDGWLPARENNGSVSTEGLPVIPSPSNSDIVIDLSAVAFMPDSIVLPVLDPVQVRVTDFPAPPTSPLPASYPPLPSIKPIQDALEQSATSLPKPVKNTLDIPPIDMPKTDDALVLAQYNAILDTKKTVDDMNDRYDKFWKSIGPLKASDVGKGDRNSIEKMKPNLECFNWNDPTCQHVEMDLREQYMRIASRPLVFLREDYRSKDEPRGIGGPCVAQEDVCSPVHPEEGGEKHLWEIIGPKTMVDTLKTLRTSVRDATLPSPIGDIPADKFPRYGTTTDNLLPSYDVPNAVDLAFPSSSSSSAP